uniref:EGF-like domain-containing protein n=1 Tax=Electrophorus electricus TaxID=8005 RepID=A0AAY5E9B1_ELEEL
TKVNSSCIADVFQVLYVAADNEIRSLYNETGRWVYEQAFLGDANVRIDAMDVHVKSKRIFWTNWHTARISVFDSSGGPTSPNSERSRRQSDTRVTDLEIPGLKMPRGIAVDWVAGNIYWTDSGRDVIEVAQMNGHSRKTLISGMIDEPYAIVVDPLRGTMYWADWGNHPKIETAAMDGTMRETLVHENIQWPTGLAVDYFNERLYWADAKLSVIGSIRLNGTDPVIAVTSIKNKLQHPFSIDVFEDYIYGITYHNNIVFRVNKFGRGNVEGLSTGMNHATDLVLYHNYKQLEVPNPCDRKKCEWLCLLSPSGPVCTCPNGHTLNNGTCVESPTPTTASPGGPCTLQCLNGGSCVLNARKHPKCRCQPNYGGDRCEINQCRDYCQNGGMCTASPTGAPTCRCVAGFTGPTCSLHTCHNYCQNGGNCTVNRGNQPTCSCPADFLGDQCQYRGCDGFCEHGGVCLQSSDGSRQCRCLPRFIGKNCELDKCQYCHGGKCIPTKIYQPQGDVTCRCVCPSCYTCAGYCSNGQCSLSPAYLPQCKCVIHTCAHTHAQPDAFLTCAHRAKGFQHQRMTNGAMNVEIGNPAYKIYEGEPDDDAGELLDSDFTLDPDKPTNFTNPVYATLYMGGQASHSSLASTDEKRELLTRGDDEPLLEPLV